MNEKQLQALKPVSDTVEAIMAARERITAAKAKAQADGIAAERRLSEVDILSITSQERRALQNAREDAAFEVLQTEALYASLAEPLKAAHAREAYKRAYELHAELSERLAKHNEAWAIEFAPVREALVRLLTERRQIADAIDRLNEGGIKSLDAEGLREVIRKFSFLFAPLDPSEHHEAIIIRARATREAQMMAEQKPLVAPEVTITGNTHPDAATVTRAA